MTQVRLRARLVARVFAIDVAVCRECGGRMRVLAVVTVPDDIARLSTAPALPRARLGLILLATPVLPPTAQLARSTSSPAMTRFASRPADAATAVRTRHPRPESWARSTATTATVVRAPGG